MISTLISLPSAAIRCWRCAWRHSFQQRMAAEGKEISVDIIHLAAQQLTEGGGDKSFHHSLLAMRLAAQLSRQLARQVTPGQVMVASTVGKGEAGGRMEAEQRRTVALAQRQKRIQSQALSLLIGLAASWRDR
jgi:hypothetical protein